MVPDADQRSEGVVRVDEESTLIVDNNECEQDHLWVKERE